MSINKLTLFNVIAQNLIKKHPHLALHKKKRNILIKSLLFKTLINQDLFSIKKIINQLLTTTQLIQKIIYKRGNLLFILPKTNEKNTYKLYTEQHKQHLLAQIWIPGTISNAKMKYKNKKRNKNINKKKTRNNFFLPNLCIIFHQLKTNKVLNETLKLHIPSIVVSDSNENPTLPTHFIPASSTIPNITKLYLNFFTKAILFGQAKKIYSFTKKTQKTKRFYKLKNRHKKKLIHKKRYLKKKIYAKKRLKLHKRRFYYYKNLKLAAKNLHRKRKNHFILPK
jgi:ribosomal protein S2